MTEDRETRPSPASAADRDLDWSILMTRAQNGDGGAYLRLLNEVTPYLRGLAARYHFDARDREDTVQDILLTLHAVRQTYDPARPFGPWLVGIAKRRAFDHLRRQGTWRANETPLTDAIEATAVAADRTDAGLDRQFLETAIGSLPPAQQKAVRLLKLKELSLKQAAAESGLSIPSLKVATHRALKQLRRILTEGGDR